MKSASTWSLHIICGLILVLLLGVHMITMHLDLVLGWFNVEPARGSVDWVNVTARGKVIGMSFFYIIFLGTALYHGLYGTRTVLFELGLKEGTQKMLSTVFVIAGIGLFLFGSIAAIVFFKTVAG